MTRNTLRTAPDLVRAPRNADSSARLLGAPGDAGRIRQNFVTSEPAIRS